MIRVSPQLTSVLLVVTIASGCDLLKSGDKDQPPPLPSAAAPAGTLAAPSLQLAPTMGVASVIAVPAAAPSSPSGVAPRPVVPGSATGTATAAPSAGATAPSPGSLNPATFTSISTATMTNVALPTVSDNCRNVCQKSYQDCITQNAAGSPVETVQKCGGLLSGCITACK